MLYQVHLTLAGFKLKALVVIGSYKSNYYAITTTAAPSFGNRPPTPLSPIKERYLFRNTCDKIYEYPF